MVSRIEIAYKSGVRDPRGEGIRESIPNVLGLSVDAVRTRDVYRIDSQLSPDELERVRTELTDPVIQESAVGRCPASPFDWIITVGFQPGVTDNVGRSTKTAIGDIVERKLPDHDAVYAATQYLVCASGMTREDATRIGFDLIANELIETIEVQSYDEWSGSAPDTTIPAIVGTQEGRVGEYDLDVDDDELKRMSREGILSLSLDEMQTIRDYFADPARRSERASVGLGPNPTDVELETLAQTWSEHCKHKIFNAVIEYTDEQGRTTTIDSLFKSYVRRATEELAERRDWLVSVFHDNAGVIRFNDKWNLVYKVETHNTPSALDPYGGAITGIVGVNRDPFGTGRSAALLINVWGYCFGSPFYEGELPEGLLHPRRIRDGVHKGVIDGGNQSGIPYGYGWEIFDERYRGKPLVYCGTVGLMPREVCGAPSHEKAAHPGDLIVMAGGRIGKDGIHGATFSSEELHGRSPAQAVQIGDPITQKKMTDFLLEARDLGLFNCITDNGAGGLSSSVGEMAQSSNGCELDLAKAPLKYHGLDVWEILLSEAQERMTLAVNPECMDAFVELATRRDVEATVLGQFTDSGKFHVRYGERTVAYLDLEFMHDGLPRMHLEAVWAAPQHEDPDPRLAPSVAVALPDVLARPNICSIEKKARQYDHEVKGLSVIKPFVGVKDDVPSDATVFAVELGSTEGIVLAAGIGPHFSDLDTYHMAASCIDLAVRRIIAVGGTLSHLAGLDNFCWPDPVQSEKTPDGHYKLAQLVRANMALYDYTKAFGVPLISGKDSMKNDSTRGGVKISIPPTLLFSALGRMPDLAKAVTMDVKEPGDLVYVLGKTRNELGGSEYYKYLGQRAGAGELVGSGVPQVDADGVIPLYEALEAAISHGLVRSAHAPAKGGLAVAFAKMAFAGELGMEIDLRRVPAEGVERDDLLLFSESNGRVVVTVAPRNRAEFEERFDGLVHAGVGAVTEGDRLCIAGLSGEPVIDADVRELKRRWQETFATI